MKAKLGVYSTNEISVTVAISRSVMGKRIKVHRKT